MNVIALSALLLTAAGWILTALTVMNLLSGQFDDRTCQTGCVQMLFFSGVAAGVAGLVLSGIGLRRPEGRIVSVIALLMAFVLCAIFAVLFIAGNLF
jgi:hypothetical protein